MEDSTRRSLQLIIDKAEKLKSLHFTKHILEQKKLSLTFTMKQQSVEINHNIADGETIDAFVLTFRFFIQASDGISFRSLAGKITDDEGLSEDWKKGLVEVRTLLDAFLETRPRLVVGEGIPSPTNREIMDVFIYGNLAHADKEKQKIYEEWESNPFWFAFIEHEFYTVLWYIFNCITRVAYLSKQELKKG